jgi:hypothetical protein
MNQRLYVIIPFFSFGNIDLRLKNLKKCLQYLLSFDNIQIVIVEGFYKTQEPRCGHFSNKILHMSYKLESIFWVKENLINLAIENLPSDWKYVAWIDSDIIFLNQNWANETISKLQNLDTVQLFQYVIYLNNKNIFDIYMHNVGSNWVLPSATSQALTDKKIFKATGFGWAMNRNFYNKIQGLYSLDVLGASDVIYSHGVFKSVTDSMSTNRVFTDPFSDNFKYSINEYVNRFPQNLKFGYISGIIVHFWHGHIKKREYMTKGKILIKHSFDPYRDLITDSNGVLILTNKNIENDLIEYFNRRED